MSKNFLETAQTYSQYGTSYPEQVRIMKKICTHLTLSPDLREQSPTIDQWLRDLEELEKAS